MTIVSLRRGRAAEQRVARRLTRWSGGAYHFQRRGLGHRGLPDLIAAAPPCGNVTPGPWPYPISVKSWPSRAPGLHGLARMAGFFHGGILERRGPGWAWWQEIPEAERSRYWLLWRAHATWWISADTDNPVWRAGPWPAILRLAGPNTLLPGWTAPFDHLLELNFRNVLEAGR